MRNSAVRVEKAVSMHTAEPPAREIREVMDIRQASDYLAISPDSLYRYASAGTIPGFRLGNRWRFRKSRLDIWMDEQSGLGDASRAKPVRAREKKPVRAVR